ncbi:uncharacterized protein NECHADRAFT_74482 [Fusarium vanettenii 77-13-4]|uniref:Uncharacterized protein n=1 Tax=Fusarium vanettenii (strain ATCC MYA-4622 / CBS 123669 / FGSC 9596 / NRRL 45880 / 77-13-4) TaxID=660122 RepID=C7YK48_FUSV7|nr:uncharacterized protein NECHADRAFT_74482 [Fusarium vanettenii 77-13-4]EEU48385.1 hypothetical protein NECHADRAFT_74482 [Fusarium vanettenii 77-13-4]
MGRSLWDTLQHLSVILPAGILWGAAIALSLPRHNDLSAVVRLGRVAPAVVFAFIASRSPPLLKSLSLVDESISFIQFCALCVIIITSAVAMRRQNAIPQPQQTEGIANEEMNSLTPGVRSQPGTPELSVNGLLETKSDLDSLLFEHMEGPKSQSPGSASSEVSALAPDSRVDPARIFEIIGWVKTVGEASSGQEGEATTRPQVLELQLGIGTYRDESRM